MGDDVSEIRIDNKRLQAEIQNLKTVVAVMEVEFATAAKWRAEHDERTKNWTESIRKGVLVILTSVIVGLLAKLYPV